LFVLSFSVLPCLIIWDHIFRTAL